ncbi:polysaccharide biosynthesis tyrosine autokinase [Mycolicibacterium sarraceniae]|uniref:non-specific protein-tyrosine kinase n=1 Tax=Mycolicibacterium sarraceniae TaxID=1534348 RepID=A0A7I7SQU8_9MYCO|nr:polysaccharide biosynthesis tyrosine autokinase [Mycolicibacterium sarraceniae]BBY59372.1 chromosome partitioning protein [Mycolicibacterium sarraceniae]
MNLQDFIKLIRNRWVTVVVTALITILGSVAYTLLQTPLYQASTRLFVSTTSGDSVSDLYNGNRLSQERVLSYTQLLMGETLAQRTIDRLQLNMTAAGLKANVTAKSKPDTVLIDVSVLDPSPVQARDIANALSDEFVVMASELETPSPGARPEARVVVEQRATVPESPVVPKKKRNLALAIVLGGILGIGIAVLRGLLDNTVKSQETLEGVTGTGVVGYIPFDKKFQAESALSFDTDNSSAAEAFRKLRTNLQFLVVDSPPRVIVVASASPNEGKTTAAINIALALAEAEQNVVLVDGDLRRPRVAKYLDVPGSVGVSNVLSGAAPLNEVLLKSAYPRLSVLAAGPTPPNPSELLGSRTAEKMFGELRTKFDYVIIDSAPLLAVTDGAVLAAHADGALVVVRAGKTKRDQLRHAIGMLNDVGATLLGAVLTMMPTRGSGAYSYNNYYFYGGESYGDKRPKRTKLESAPSSGSDHDRGAGPITTGRHKKPESTT